MSQVSPESVERSAIIKRRIVPAYLEKTGSRPVDGLLKIFEEELDVSSLKMLADSLELADSSSDPYLPSTLVGQAIGKFRDDQTAAYFTQLYASPDPVYMTFQ